MLKTKEQWRNLALGLAAIHIAFMIFLAQTNTLISRDECSAVVSKMLADLNSTRLYKMPPPE